MDNSVDTSVDKKNDLLKGSVDGKPCQERPFSPSIVDQNYDQVSNGEHCQQDQTCLLDWQKMMQKTNRYNRSVTSLGNLSGIVPLDTDEGSSYGASFAPAIGNTPYYESMVTETVDAPWLAQPQEATFLNRTTVPNKPEVETYKNLKLSPIPQQKYETYEPVVYTGPESWMGDGSTGSVLENFNGDANLLTGPDAPVEVKNGEVTITKPPKKEGVIYAYIVRIMCVFVAFLLIYAFMKNFNIFV